MNLNLDEPGRVTPKTILYDFLKSFKHVMPILIVILIAPNNRQSLVGELVGLGVIGIHFVIAALSWANLRYYIENNQIVMKSGWIQRNEMRIPLERIQTVDWKQDLLQRILHIAEVHVDSGGAGAGAEMKLQCLTTDDAEALKRYLQDHRGTPATAVTEGGAPPVIAPPEPRETILRLSLNDLASYGMMGNAALLLVIIPMGFIQKFHLEDSVLKGHEKDIQKGLQLPWGWIAFALLVLWLIGWVANIVMTIFKYFDFELTREGNVLHRSYGLFNKQVKLIPLGRIQKLVWSAPAIPRHFGIWRMDAIIAGHKAGTEPGKADFNGGILAPVLRSNQIPQVANLAFASSPMMPGHGWQRPTSRSRAMAWTVFGLAILIAIGIGVWIATHMGSRRQLVWGLLIGAHALIATLILTGISMTLVTTRFRFTGAYLFVKQGWYNARYTMLPLEKVQTVHLHQGWLGRLMNTATVQMMVAGGNVTISGLHYPAALKLVHQLRVPIAETGTWSASGI